MSKTWKKVGVVSAAAAGLVLAGALALKVAAQSGTASDRQALRQIKADYESAVNKDNMAALAPHVSSNFSATMATGQVVKSFGDFETYWKTMKTLVGIGPNSSGSYEASLTPVDSFFVGNYAFSFGTSKEKLVTDVPIAGGRRESKTYEFNSNWYSLCEKENGTWKLRSARVVVDPFRTTFSDQKIQGIVAASDTAMKQAGLTP